MRGEPSRLASLLLFALAVGLAVAAVLVAMGQAQLALASNEGILLGSALGFLAMALVLHWTGRRGVQACGGSAALILLASAAGGAFSLSGCGDCRGNGVAVFYALSALHASSGWCLAAALAAAAGSLASLPPRRASLEAVPRSP